MPGLEPLRDALADTYWTAAAEGELLIQRCDACGQYQFYPRGHCVHCFAADPGWVVASGTGRVHTFSVIHRTPNQEFAADCPYVFAIVELTEGVHLATRIVDCDPAAVRCDADVHVAFHPTDGGVPLPVFTLDAA